MPAPDKPALRFLHSQSSLNSVKLDQFRRCSSNELRSSLLPGQRGSLKARPDGTFLDGHHRITVLIERGDDIHALPREIIEKERWAPTYSGFPAPGAAAWPYPPVLAEAIGWRMKFKVGNGPESML